MLHWLNSLVLRVYLVIAGGGRWVEGDYFYPENDPKEPVFARGKDDPRPLWWSVVMWVYGLIVFAAVFAKYSLSMETALMLAEHFELTGVFGFMVDFLGALALWAIGCGSFAMLLCMLCLPIASYCRFIHKITRKKEYLAGHDGQPSAYFYSPANKGYELTPNKIAENKMWWGALPVTIALAGLGTCAYIVCGLMLPLAVLFNL